MYGILNHATAILVQRSYHLSYTGQLGVVIVDSHPAKQIELFGNRTQSIDWARKSNQIEPENLCESSIGFDFRTQSNLIELNRTQSNLIEQCRNHFINQAIEFD